MSQFQNPQTPPTQAKPDMAWTGPLAIVSWCMALAAGLICMATWGAPTAAIGLIYVGLRAGANAVGLVKVYDISIIVLSAPLIGLFCLGCLLALAGAV